LNSEQARSVQTPLDKLLLNVNIPFTCSIIGSNSYILACDYFNDGQNFPPFPVYVTEEPSSSSRLVDALHHPPFLAVFTALLAPSPSQISAPQQMMTTLTAYDLSARSYSTFCFSLIGPEFGHICNALAMMVPALDRVCLVGQRQTNFQLWPYRTQRMLQWWQPITTLWLTKRRKMLLNTCSKGLQMQFGAFISDHRTY